MIKLPTITDQEAREFLEEKKIYDEIISRITEITGAKDKLELADYFGCTVSSVGSNLRNLIIPDDWIKKLIVEKGISPNWVLHGEGNKEL